MTWLVSILRRARELDAFDGVVGPRQILVSADGGQLILAGVGGEGEQQVSALYVLDRATGKRVLSRCPWGSPWPEWRLPPMGGGRGLSPGTTASSWPSTRPIGRRRGGSHWAWASTRWCSRPTGETLFVGNSIGGQVHAVDAETLALRTTVEGLAAPKGPRRRCLKGSRMKNVKLIVPIISLVCAAVVCGAVLLWAPVCAGTLELANGNMVPMRCAYTAKVAVLLALVLAAVAVAALVTKRPMTVALVLLSVAIVLMTFDTPLSIGVCKSADMACQATAVWLRVAGGVSAVAALAGALLNPDRKRVAE